MVSSMGKVGSKAMLLITVLVIVGVPLFAEGVRELKNAAAAEVVHPENFYGGFGTGVIYPAPDGGIPSVGSGAGVGVTGHGSSVDFCSYPGLGCVRVQPTNPGAGSVGGVGGTPLPFP